MRKYLVFLLMSLMTTMAWGVKVVTFLPGEHGDVEPVAGDHCVTEDCVTMCCTSGLFSQVQFRFYKSSVTTFTSTCGDIIKIEFTCTTEGESQYGPGCFTPDSGTYTYQGKTGLWEGAAAQVSFTAVTNQVRATRIDVYVNDGALYPPKIEPAAGTYYEPIEVKISCMSSAAAIYYTLDGSDPTTASTLYTMPFSLSSDATVKAVAVRDGEMSDVVCAAYQFGTTQPFRCFEDLDEMLPDETVVRLEAPLCALAQYKARLYVKDECGGYALIYGNTGQTYQCGDVIPAGVVLHKTTYDGMPEYTIVGGFKPADGNNPVEPVVITPDQVGPGTSGHYVCIHNGTISKIETGNGYILTDADGNWCVVYFGMGVSAPKDLPKTYRDVIGIVWAYGMGDEIVYQLLPTMLSNEDPENPMGFGLLEMVDDETEVTMNYNATVIVQKGSYLFAFDETGFGLVYGNTGQAYRMGDVIPAGFGGVKRTYSCEPELANPHDFQPPIDHVALYAEEITPAQVGHSTWAHYVFLRHVRIDQGNRLFIDEEGNQCSYYNMFNVQLPDDPEGYYDIYGVVYSYGRNGDCIYQILPLPGMVVDPPLVCCFEDLFAFPQGELAQFDCPLAVVYQSGNYTYVKDKCGEFGLLYGNVGNTFENGDSIIGSASWTTYQGIRQLTSYGTWDLVSHGPKVNPAGPMMIEDISQDMVHWYVYFEDVTVVKDEERDRYYTMTDEYGDEMVLYNQLGIEIPTDYLIGTVGPDLNISFLNKIIEYILTGKGLTPPPPPDPVIVDTWKPCRVEGLVSIYRDQLELVPTHVTYEGTFNGGWDDRWYDLNNDGVINVSDLSLGIELILKE